MRYACQRRIYYFSEKLLMNHVKVNTRPRFVISLILTEKKERRIQIETKRKKISRYRCTLNGNKDAMGKKLMCARMNFNSEKCAFSHQFYFARNDFVRYHYKIFHKMHCLNGEQTAENDFNRWQFGMEFPNAYSLLCWMFRYAAVLYPIFITACTHRTYNEHA